jgi:hypothetical protein
MLKRTESRGLVWALLAPALALAGPAAAAPVEAEVDRPYDLQIVLHVADHRLLTDVFRERVSRELRVGMQAALGELARVTVVHEHPRLKDVLRYGLDRALDGWAERNGVKTHFVLIDYSGVQYEIQARQHDGITGRPSRVVRRDHTRDRDFVAKAAALLVARDFGMVGTVVSEPDAREMVRVELKAGALGSLARWVRKGQVFEIIPPGGTAALDWALLQVEEAPSEESRGPCTCRLWHRYRLGSLTGHRCLLLGTTKAPLRVRFVQEKVRGVRTPLDATLTVAARHTGFQGEDQTRLTGHTAEAGWVRWNPHEPGRDVFEDVAFVSVTGGMKAPLPQVPVAVVDDKPVIIPVVVTGESSGLFASRRAIWERNVADSLLVQINLFNEIQELTSKPDGQAQALEKARAGLSRTRADIKSLKDERGELAREAARPGGGPFIPAREEQRLKELERGEDQLTRFVSRQEEILRDESDPKKREARRQVERGRLLEQEGEAGKAIAVYEKALKDGLDSAELRAHLEDLKKRWTPADDKHAEARAFIYKVWPGLDLEGLRAQLPEADARGRETEPASQHRRRGAGPADQGGHAGPGEAGQRHPGVPAEGQAGGEVTAPQRRGGGVGRELRGGGGAPTRMGVLHRRQGTTLLRSCSSTSMNLRQRGLGHCTANTPAGPGSGMAEAPRERGENTGAASRPRLPILRRGPRPVSCPPRVGPGELRGRSGWAPWRNRV